MGATCGQVFSRLSGKDGLGRAAGGPGDSQTQLTVRAGSQRRHPRRRCRSRGPLPRKRDGRTRPGRASLCACARAGPCAPRLRVGDQAPLQPAPCPLPPGFLRLPPAPGLCHCHQRGSGDPKTLPSDPAAPAVPGPTRPWRTPRHSGPEWGAAGRPTPPPASCPSVAPGHQAPPSAPAAQVTEKTGDFHLGMRPKHSATDTRGRRRPAAPCTRGGRPRPHRAPAPQRFRSC